MEYLLGILIVVLFVRWIVLSKRFADLHERIDEIDARRAREIDTTQELIAALTRRVHFLEGKTQTEVVAEIAAAAPERPVQKPPELPHITVPDRPPAIPERTKPDIVVPPPIPAFAANDMSAAEQNWQERVERKIAGKEWEAVLGENWLNKVGMLVLVIGIALALGYSFTRIGPAGRVALGAVVSLAMLAAGVLVERKEQYVTFARGLIGGGWAALYFTTYATYAVAAAKVIENPILASILLCVVAAGMILHSLRYRSQTVTALAYFISFATLTLTPVTSFSVIALLPLAASLLYLANRFNWYEMAFFGVLATYGTCASRGDSSATLMATQSLVAGYWLLFETFNCLRAGKRGEYSIWEKLIFPLNTAGLFLLSFFKWQHLHSPELYIFFAGFAALHVAGALIRARLRPTSSFDAESTVLERAFSGGYEAPVTVAVGCGAVSILLKLPGLWSNAGLLAEAEILFLLGLWLGEVYLQRLADAVFLGSLVKLAGLDLRSTGSTSVANLKMLAWTPIAALSAGIFYLNRILKRSALEYSYAACAVITTILGFEAAPIYVGFAWLCFAVLQFEFGIRARLREFCVQAYFVGIFGIGGVALQNILEQHTTAKYAWIPLALSALLTYAATLRFSRTPIDFIAETEAALVGTISSGATAIFLTALIWKVVPNEYAGLGWLTLGLLLFELGLRKLPVEFRWQSYFVAAAGCFTLLLENVFPASKSSSLADRISLAGAALVAYGFTARVFRARTDFISDSERNGVRDLSSFAGTLFLTTVAWIVLPDAVVAVGWAALALLLLEVGLVTNTDSLRMQGDLLGAATFGRLFFANFTTFGVTAGISHRLLTVLPIVLAQYYSCWRRQQEIAEGRLSPWDARINRGYLYAPAILIVLVSRFEFGRVLAVDAWAFFALFLFWVGLRRGNEDLRWQSYTIAALTFWRSWTTNFYMPESLAGMPGRIVTGAIVIAAFYAAQIIAPRTTESPGESGNFFRWIDRNARTLFSLLATTLLTALLFYEVSGGLLTVAWGSEAVLLLLMGFVARDRALRLSGLVLFLVCILKLFIYDLRHLETLNRILSFIVLGAVMVAVSWIYTRFRDHIQRYL